MLNGIQIKDMTVHTDERGFFTELIRSTDPFFEGMDFAQLSHSMAKQGVVKAWHLHQKQTDYMYVVSGDIKLGLYDTREGSSTHKRIQEVFMGETYGRKVVKIPPGIAHGYKIINGPMHIIYLMDKVYDPDDIYYRDHDDPEIAYDWNE
ncbi:MAG: dTDP-4-dehydrorhamnose 3,5-epimerase family protein [Candidatus Omnitrophica bacterium]|nr:dTDP-4-dehydrorhamnose 3,5-epimerase family protein [Candidatus Omnitrophota bacterium]